MAPLILINSMGWAAGFPIVACRKLNCFFFSLPTNTGTSLKIVCWLLRCHILISCIDFHNFSFIRGFHKYQNFWIIKNVFIQVVSEHDGGWWRGVKQFFILLCGFSIFHALIAATRPFLGQMKYLYAALGKSES